MDSWQKVASPPFIYQGQMQQLEKRSMSPLLNTYEMQNTGGREGSFLSYAARYWAVLVGPLAFIARTCDLLLWGDSPLPMLAPLISQSWS